MGYLYELLNLALSYLYSYKQHTKQPLLLTRLMGQCCFAGWRLSSVFVVCWRHMSSSVTLPAGGRAGRQARGRSSDRHCTAGQYGYVPLGRHLAIHYSQRKFLSPTWDHTRIVVNSVYCCANFGWNRPCSFEDMRVSMLREFGFKMHIYAQKATRY